MTTDLIKTLLADIIGTYQATGTDIAGVDWEYLAAAATFLVCLWFMFSFIRTFL